MLFFSYTERNGLGKITIFIVTVGQTQIMIKFTTIYSKNSYVLSNFYYVYSNFYYKL